MYSPPLIGLLLRLLYFEGANGNAFNNEYKAMAVVIAKPNLGKIVCDCVTKSISWEVASLSYYCFH